MRIFLVLKASYGASSIVNYGAEPPRGLNLMTAVADKILKNTEKCEHEDPPDASEVNDCSPGVDNYAAPGTTQSGLALY